MTLLELDPFDLIDLADFITAWQVEIIRNLYTLHNWDWYPPHALKWRFADVCALFFRVRRHADIFSDSDEYGNVLAALERAISEYQEDEFA